MAKNKPFYITTTLPYVNASPHIGFALEIVQADALARFARLMRRDVFFNTGSDEHGQKIAEAAQSSGVSPQEYVDKYAKEFKTLKDLLGLSVDKFVRTTDESHIKTAQKLWTLADKKGDIYKKSYKGLYCVGCEAFMKDTDLDESGQCPHHLGKQLEEVEEENYFFRLSNYKEQLREYLNKPESVVPEWRRKEALQILGDFGDFSISRPKERLQWGIPVPGDDSQVMYVWFDALSNYISTLDYADDSDNFNKFWTEGQTIQVAGKDQIKFQSIMWQAMLMSAGIKNTDTVFYHGFITSGGKKMSKSLGNVINPSELVERYGTEATRYILLRHIHPTDDSDLTWEKMDEIYTANLVNGLGNLVARIMKMAQDYLDKPIDIDHRVQENKDVIYAELYTKPIINFDFLKTMDIIWLNIQEVDQIITDTEPFKLFRNGKEREAQLVVISLIESLSLISERLIPFMPQTAKIIKQAIKQNKKPDNLFKRLDK